MQLKKVNDFGFDLCTKKKQKAHQIHKMCRFDIV